MVAGRVCRCELIGAKVKLNLRGLLAIDIEEQVTDSVKMIALAVLGLSVIVPAQHHGRGNMNCFHALYSIW